MRRLKWLTLSYQSEKHQWPDADKWTSELEAYVANFDQMALKNLTNDAWNHPILFEFQTNNNEIKPFFRSFGPNRLDDHSMPDDIVIGVTDKHSNQNSVSRPAP